MNAAREFLKEFGLVKQADMMESLSKLPERFGSGMVHGVAAAGATAVIGGVGMAASKIFNAATQAHDFRNMLQYNPDLVEHHERDPRMFNQMFASLRGMNPGFSKDPLVAGTYMRRMVDNPLTAGGILTEAVGTRDKFPNLVDRATEEGVNTGVAHLKPKNPNQGQQQK